MAIVGYRAPNLDPILLLVVPEGEVHATLQSRPRGSLVAERTIADEDLHGLIEVVERGVSASGASISAYVVAKQKLSWRRT